MAKILLIFFAIIIGIVVATGWVLGAIRRMLGISTRRQSGFSFHTNFNAGRARKTADERDDVVYDRDDVVVLRGKSRKEERGTGKSTTINRLKKMDEGEIRDVDYRDKSA